MSSKFSTPFLNKSPLQGAYESGADGLAFMGGTISGQEHFAKLYSDIGNAVDKAYNTGVKCPSTQKLKKGVCVAKTAEDYEKENKKVESQGFQGDFDFAFLEQ
jgi:hypothetical protein|tara:strand:- start:225 stop:533 length:309 start_codon:yes stop_codon:yes gene_type:complete